MSIVRVQRVALLPFRSVALERAPGLPLLFQLMRVMGVSHRLGSSVPRSKRRPDPASPMYLFDTAQSMKLPQGRPTGKGQRGKTNEGQRPGCCALFSLCGLGLFLLLAHQKVRQYRQSVPSVVYIQCCLFTYHLSCLPSLLTCCIPHPIHSTTTTTSGHPSAAPTHQTGNQGCASLRL
jgi:hypothetical protein